MAQRIEMQICLGSSCFSRGNRDVVAFIRKYLKRITWRTGSYSREPGAWTCAVKDPISELMKKSLRELLSQKLKVFLEKNSEK